MPQTTSAKKELRAGARRRVVNDRWRVKLRLAVRAVRDAITAKDAKTAQTAFVAAQAAIDRATKHHILTPNVASRRKSRLTKAIQKIAA